MKTAKVLTKSVLALLMTLSSSLSIAAEADNFIAQKLNLPDQSEQLNDLANRYLDNVLIAANASASYCDENVLNIALKRLRKIKAC